MIENFLSSPSSARPRRRVPFAVACTSCKKRGGLQVGFQRENNNMQIQILQGDNLPLVSSSQETESQVRHDLSYSVEFVIQQQTMSSISPIIECPDPSSYSVWLDQLSVIKSINTKKPVIIVDTSKRGDPPPSIAPTTVFFLYTRRLLMCQLAF